VLRALKTWTGIDLRLQTSAWFGQWRQSRRNISFSTNLKYGLVLPNMSAAGDGGDSKWTPPKNSTSKMEVSRELDSVEFDKEMVACSGLAQTLPAKI